MIGATSGLSDYSPELHLTAGRLFQPGLRELIASNACARNYADFASGDRHAMRGGDWQVVGNFDMGSSAGMCVVFADADVLQGAFGRNDYNEVNVMLESPASFEALSTALKANPSMHVEARHEADLAEEDTKDFNGFKASPFGFTFHLAVTAPTVAIGIFWALAMGLLGGVFPALRAARVPVTVALRAV